MSQVPQHLIDEATKRGIVPGAKVICTTACDPKANRTHGIVAPYSEWNFCEIPGRPWISAGLDNSGSQLFIHSEGKWSTVLTPATAQPQGEGLKEGDAVECGPAMRAAIIELADTLGITVFARSRANNGDPNLCWSEGEISGISHPIKWSMAIIRTPEEFIRRMRVTAARPKPITITINGNKVKFNTGSITVGCTTVDNATVRAIAEKLID